MQYLPWAIKPTLVMGLNALFAYGYEKIKLQRYIEYEISM
jgi:hypothetical protein